MRKTQNIYKAMHKGGHLTDAEIDHMIGFFDGVVSAVAGLDEYNVVRTDALTRLSVLRSIKSWRDGQKKYQFSKRL